MQKLLAILALGLSATVPASFALPSSVPDPAIETFIDQEMPAAAVPGLSYAVVKSGEIVSAGSRGTVRVGGEAKVTPDTAFLSGSISKSFTALAVMQLVEAGTVNLDTELSHYLDNFSGQPAGPITIRQLLSHTSGFSTLQGNNFGADSTGEKDELARVVENLAEVTPEFPRGQVWQYSNTNYAILGRVVEVVSGQEFQTYIADNILEPLGMTHSFVADGEIHESMATGHTPWFGTRLPLDDYATDRTTAPQGGIVASANDLARYLQMMMNGKDDVLSAEGKAQMMRPASDVSPFYGFGWFLDSSDGTVWHDGASPGFETLATMIPTEKSAVVVLVNSGSGLGFGETTHLRNGITAIALDLEYEGDGSRWSQKALFLGVALLPIFYLFSMVWAWIRRTTLRAKFRSGFFGTFSAWFPLLTTAAAAWVFLALVPAIVGAPLSTILVFQPDFGVAVVASAVTGVLWAVFRLAVGYSGAPRRRTLGAQKRIGRTG